MKKDTAHFMEYHWQSSETKSGNWRQKNEHLTLPVLILPSEMGLVQSAYGFNLSSALGQFFTFHWLLL